MGYRRDAEAEAADVDEDDSLSSVEAEGEADSPAGPPPPINGPVGPAEVGVARSLVASSCRARLRLCSVSRARERLQSARSSFMSVFVALRFSILPSRFAIVALAW